MTDTLFKAAGISTNGKDVKFHVSRDTKNKEMFVSMNGQTTFTFYVLPTPMTKSDAAAFLKTKISCVDPEQQANLDKALSGPVVTPKVPKAPKAPKAAGKPKIVKKSNAVAIMKAAAAPVTPADEAAKAKRLETIRAIAAKRNA